MEFDININLIFKDPVTRIDNRLQVCRNADIRYPDARQQLFNIIDRMGEASAKAQGLAGSITTGRKLEMSEHHLYLMKDSDGNSGLGVVVGILKIGRKRLFVYDRHGQQWEMEPMCVLDFYVHESRQRMGCGRRLFDFMLKNENLSPCHLAVDRPSLKFSSFLAKHYRLRNEIPQVNNFVIFDGFFTKRQGADFVNNRRNVNMARPADYPNEGAADRKQHNSDFNSYNNGSHGYNNGSSGHHGSSNGYNNSSRVHNYQQQYNNSRPPSGHRTNGQSAGLPSILPRHRAQDNAELKDLNIKPRSRQETFGTENTASQRLNDVELRSISAGSSSGRASALQLQTSMYSRHQANSAKESQSHRPVYTTAQQPQHGSNNALCSQPGNPSIGLGTRREKSPPLLQRDGAPRDYKDSFNLHQNYQGRTGHLVVPSDPRVALNQPPTSTASNLDPGLAAGKGDAGSAGSAKGGGGSQATGYYTSPSLPGRSDTSWTVHGVLRNQNQVMGHYGRTRLW